MITTIHTGAGRPPASTVAADIATLLARWHYRTLCIDWNLTAPGITDRFGPMLFREPEWGTVDLVRDAGQTRTPDRYPVAVPLPDAGGRLDLLPSRGRRSAGSSGAVDWLALHRDRYLGEFLESCAERWRADYDAVLIDAPSGTGPASAISVAHLPDAVVLVTAADRIETAADLVSRIDRARDRLPYDRSRLLVVPCVVAAPAGAGPDGESWTVGSGARLASVFDDWAAREVPVARLAEALTLGLDFDAAARSEGPLRTVAALLARELRDTELLLTESSTQEYVAQAASGPAGGGGGKGTAARVRGTAVRALKNALLEILPAADWMAIERSVLTMSEALDVGDTTAIGDAAADIALLTVRSTTPRTDQSAIPADLRVMVERVIQALRSAP